ncbi:MAG TPA: hypothetical protein G4O11_09135 [Anaerolineae bacterium]|nr:hypothetical protein [Anaerolineae bacterium]
MAKTKKKTSRAAYWQEHISQWSESGLTQAEYCRRNKLSAAGFHWWKGQLRRKARTQKTSSTSMQFVEVHGVPSAHVGHGENSQYKEEYILGFPLNKL